MFPRNKIIMIKLGQPVYIEVFQFFSGSEFWFFFFSFHFNIQHQHWNVVESRVVIWFVFLFFLLLTSYKCIENALYSFFTLRWWCKNIFIIKKKLFPFLRKKRLAFPRSLTKHRDFQYIFHKTVDCKCKRNRMIIKHKIDNIYITHIDSNVKFSKKKHDK